MLCLQKTEDWSTLIMRFTPTLRARDPARNTILYGDQFCFAFVAVTAIVFSQAVDFLLTTARVDTILRPLVQLAKATDVSI